MNRKHRNSLIAVILVVVIFTSLGVVFLQSQDGRGSKQPAPFPTPAATRDARWVQDVDYLASELVALHVNPFHTVSETDFNAAVSQLREQVPALSDDQIRVEMARIVAMIGDGHTALQLLEPELTHIYPLRFALVDGTVLVVGARESERNLIGGEVVQIGETAIDDVLAAIEPLVARDNEQQLRGGKTLFLRMAEVLAALGILPDATTGDFTIRSAEHEVLTVSLSPVALDENVNYLSLYDVLEAPVPISQSNRQAFYWYTFLEESGTLYFQYNQCAEDPELPFETFTDDLFAFIDANPVQRIVIDLRYNGGGNSAILHPFTRALREHEALNREGQVYVLIGSGTFSSALMNAIELNRDTAAILVGEPTGGKPNHYGEVLQFSLPNSGLVISYATRFWLLVPGDNSPSLVPEMPVTLTRDALLSGADPVLEAAIAAPVN